MPLTKINQVLNSEIEAMRSNNTAKGDEMIVEKVLPASGRVLQEKNSSE